MRDHGGGSHNNHAHPDHKMSPKHNKPSRYAERRGDPIKPMTSTQRQVLKKVANAKRRQRDKECPDG